MTIYLLRRKYWKIQSFSASKEKEVKNLVKIKKTTSYELQFLDSLRFMASSLTNLVHNLSFEGIHKIKRKHEHGHDNGKG